MYTIKKDARIEYFTADIMEGVADYTVDMTKMLFEDDRFDYIIANHVLEHIQIGEGSRGAKTLYQEGGKNHTFLPGFIRYSCC